MKSRQGFVSNSSSTSFCVIGVDYYDYDKAISREKGRIVNTLAELEGVDIDDENSFRFGVEQGPHIEFFGSEGRIYHLGLDAKKLLQGMAIPEARKYCVDKVVEWYGLEIPLSYVEFLYGESGSG